MNKVRKINVKPLIPHSKTIAPFLVCPAFLANFLILPIVPILKGPFSPFNKARVQTMVLHLKVSKSNKRLVEEIRYLRVLKICLCIYSEILAMNSSYWTSFSLNNFLESKYNDLLPFHGITWTYQPFKIKVFSNITLKKKCNLRPAGQLVQTKWNCWGKSQYSQSECQEVHGIGVKLLLNWEQNMLYSKS